MLILASNSPRRKQLLSLAGWHFIALGSEIDEAPFAGEAALDYVLRLTREKAQAVARNPIAMAQPDALIVSADTTVALEGEIFGKPADAVEAERFLERLRAKVHQVHTGLAILNLSKGDILFEQSTTDVAMRAYSAEEVQAYIASGDPFDKAGGYAIQHGEFQPVASLEGCYGNVVGLPLCLLRKMLAELGVLPDEPPKLACDGTSEGSCAIKHFFAKNE